MDISANTSSVLLRNSQHRDPAAPRRAYLDTYARRRAGLSDKPKIEPLVVQQVSPIVSDDVVVQSVPQVMPYVVEQPPVLPTNESTSVSVESPVDYLGQEVQIAAIPQAKSQNLITSEKEHLATHDTERQQSHRSYLDTLTRRHEQAVAQAPAREETVFQPILNDTTEQLIEDHESEKRLEANLRALYEDQSLTNQITKSAVSTSAAHIRAIVGSALACGVLAVGIFTFASSYDTRSAVALPVGAPVIEVEAPAKQPTGGTPIAQNNSGAPVVDPAHPVRLVIGSIGVNAPVEGLGTTPEGLIAVPKSYGVVGWYNKGAIPGRKGPAVLVGHFTGGGGGVFDKLQDLNNGDLITTTNGRGESVTYKVSAKNVYEKDSVPMAEILKNSDESRLEIITCTGKWQAKTYDKRLVVTAEIVK